MKLMLYEAVETAPSAEHVEPEFLTRHFAKFDERFFHYCDKELAKINTFFSGNFYFRSLNKKLFKLILLIHILIFACRKNGRSY